MLRSLAGTLIRALARYLLTLAGLVALAAWLNWGALVGLFRFAGLGSLAVSEQESYFTVGLLVATFGFALPFAWLAAAHGAAATAAGRFLFRRHRDDLLAGVAGVLRADLASSGDEDVARWRGTYARFEAMVDTWRPTILRPVLRFAIRQVDLRDVEERVLRGSGPVSVRLAGAIVDRVEEEMAGSAATALWVVALVNAAAMIAGAVVLR